MNRSPRAASPKLEPLSFQAQLEKTSPSTPYPSVRASLVRRWAWGVRRWLARHGFGRI